MTVSDIIEMYEALIIFADSDKLSGKLSYRIAKNISILKPTAQVVYAERQKWLKGNATMEADGSYNLKGAEIAAYNKHMAPIEREEEIIPDGIKKLRASDIPDGIKGNVLVQLLPIIEETD